MELTSPIPLCWEQIPVDFNAYFISRAAVFGGWLVRTQERSAISITFVPDRNHEWSLNESYAPETQS